MSEEHATDLTEEVVDDAEEVEAETTEELEPEQELESEEEAETEDGDDEEEEDAEELEEFDFGGNKMEIPKGAVPEELSEKIKDFTKGIWSDYTKKSQDVAEKVKSVDTAQAAVDRMQNLSGATLEKFGKAMYLSQEIQQLQETDLSALWQSDPDQARQVSDYISTKQAEYQSITAEVSKGENEFQAEKAQETARLIDEGKQIVERTVKGFNESEVVKYAVDNGIPQKDAESWGLNPTTAIMAHKAMMFDRLQAKATKPAPKKQAKPVKPMKTTGKTTRPFDPNRDADRLPVDEWVRRENARLQKKAARQ